MRVRGLHAIGLAVLLALMGCGGGAGGGSTSALGPGSPGMDQAADEAAMTAIESTWTDAINQGLLPPAQAQAVLAAMQANPQFASCGISPDNSVWGIFKDGVGYGVFTNEPDLDQLTSVEPFQYAQAGLASPTQLPSFRAVPAVLPAPGELPGSANAYVLNALSSNPGSLIYFPSPTFAANLQAAGYNVVDVPATLENWRAVQNAGVLLNGSHGSSMGPNQVFVVSTASTYPIGDRTYIQELLDNTLFVYGVEVFDLPTAQMVQKYGHGERIYAMSAGFLNQTGMFAPNSFMFNTCCYGMSPSGSAFGSYLGSWGGLSVYGGWTEPVRVSDAMESVSFFMDRALGLNQFDPIDPSCPPPGDWAGILEVMQSTPRASDAGYNLDTCLRSADEKYPTGIFTFQRNTPPGTALTTLIPSIASNSYDPAHNLVTLTGSFGSAQGTVNLNGTALSVAAWSDSTITATPTATTGYLQVISPGGLKSNQSSFGPLTLAPRSANITALGGTAAFTVTVGGYSSDALTYIWGPSSYGTFTDGCQDTGATVTCKGTPTATYTLTAGTLPGGIDNFAVQVLDPDGNSLGTVYGNVTFTQTSADRFTGLYSGMVTSNGSQIPVSVGAGCTPGTNEVSFECNFNDLFTWEGEGTEDGNVASMPDPPNDSVATWTILGPGWTTLTLSDPGAGYTGTFARAPVNVPNLTGQTWFSTEVVDVSNCGKSPYTRYNTYVISQPGMGGWLLWPYWPGFVATASDGIALSLTSTAASGVQVSGSYPLDGGIARVSGQLNLSPDGKTYSGTLNWSWKGAAGSCTGTTLFSASIFTAS